MSVIETRDAFVVPAAEPISLSQMFAVTPSNTNPAYLVLTGLDRDEYTAGATDATGSLSGDGHVEDFGYDGGDARSLGIVFTYQASSGRYYNATYGYLNQLTYTASASLNDVTNLSLFGSSSLALADEFASNPYALMQIDSAGFLGSITIATQPKFDAAVPTQATPDSIAAVAKTFVGDAWNMDGCWVLASTIAAEAGAGLPVQSTAIQVPGKPNGEWMVAFNGPAGQTGNWQSMVRAGDIIVIGNSSGLGHITTCVSGSGANAKLVDNITYIGANGQIVNPAGDGSSDDVTIAAPHLASQEWANVQTGDVVIYRLDTPVVTTTESTAKVAAGSTLALRPMFSASDPAGKAISKYQVYDTASSDRLLVNGASVSAHTAAAAANVTSLNSVCLAAGGSACTDSVEVRAFNGSYWGDWQALTVSVSARPAPALASSRNTGAVTDTLAGTAPITPETLGLYTRGTNGMSLLGADAVLPSARSSRPELAAQTASSLWNGGPSMDFLPAYGAFQASQGLPPTYSAFDTGSADFPAWMGLEPTTNDFSVALPNRGIELTANDGLGLPASGALGLNCAAAGTLAPALPLKLAGTEMFAIQ